ncbi:hypothetical protein H4R99_002101 [Coemansia sp. RSA 1722]|nr:hypothetical protein LPJ57_000752 [Coemansia sp. RSA 486]KAJ2236350.1 hypothetical protein IWW45_001862 [Coemansia sp. RSA 485]KAJ2598518.1 hypothetical protein GGF39_002623 [Coemansia sp. RSA 1721]KAJ2603980.1 hypothetical protein H4R99_002101 [Coemansia sp. RSA 1722]
MTTDMTTESSYVRSLFIEVLSSPSALACDAVLLSGGLDTSLASETVKTLIPRHNESQLSTAITLTIDPGNNQLAQAHGLFAQSPQDIVYANQIATKLNLQHHVLEPTLDELLNGKAMEICVKVLGTFDGMELRNAVVIAQCLMRAKALGCKRVLTGDGADELFAGYSFMHAMDDGRLRQYISEMAKTMAFCAQPLARHLGINVWSPYLDQRVIDYAVSARGASRMLKVGEFQGTMHGKLVLRQAFPEVVSAARKKEPIECGCGTAVLPKMADLLLTDTAFAREAKAALEKHDVVLRDKEQMLYFRIFAREFMDQGLMPGSRYRYGQGTCRDCRFSLDPGSVFCKVCGLYPAI